MVDRWASRSSRPNSLSLDSLTMLFTSFTTTLCRSWPSRIIIADPGTGVTGLMARSLWRGT